MKKKIISTVTILNLSYLYCKPSNFLSLTSEHIETLLVLCQEGNQLAQVEIYNRYNKAMYNVAFRILNNSAEAEDVMQDSFLTAFEKLNTFKGTASFGSWLKRIVVNNSISQYRKSQRYVSLSDNYSDSEEDSTTEIFENSEHPTFEVRKLMHCMDNLNDNYRNVLNLHFIEGYDYKELCEILEISYANCRTLISRAKDSLRKKLVINYEQ